jgi:hypothetical protein
MIPTATKTQHEFDVFVKKPKIGWRFDSRIQSESLEKAKIAYLDANPYLQPNYVTVYPRR